MCRKQLRNSFLEPSRLKKGGGGLKTNSPKTQFKYMSTFKPLGLLTVFLRRILQFSEKKKNLKLLTLNNIIWPKSVKKVILKSV